MKKKKKKVNIFRLLFWAAFLILLGLFIFQTKWEREMTKHYNRGNQYYNDAEYSLAQSEYSLALEAAKKLIMHKECAVRCNLALAIVTPLTPESVTEENLDETIGELRKARRILIENDCAHLVDNKGHDAECQVLKNEIEAYMDQLLNPPELADDTEETEGGQADAGEDGTDDAEKQIREALEQIQREGIIDRKGELDTAEALGNYEFYDGARW